MGVFLSGLASGFDWTTLVDQLAQAERAPQQRMRADQSVLEQRNNAYSGIKTELGVLQTRVDALKDPTLFNSRLTNVGDSTVASASAGPTAATGTYTFSFTQLATNAVQQGAADVGAPLSATNDVSGLVLANASFATAVKAGTLTVNGQQVTIATTDTLQGVFDKISTASGGTVTGSYDATTDKITLAGAGPITLGSGADTSNFFQVAQLFNNGGNSVTSGSALGGVRSGAALASANLRTAVSDGGSGAGAFTVNGVSIAFNAATDSLSDVLARINDSTAAVTASYDSLNDRLVLRDKNTGDVGIALQDVSGNFLAATGLSGGTLQRGKNLLYSVNGGPQLTSSSNTITEASSGIPGLSVTAAKEGASTTVTVGSDTAKIKTAITDFLDEYNKAQSMIDTQTTSSTDAKGKVTANPLTGDSDANNIAAQLRSLVGAQVSGLAGTIKQLAALGIESNGNDNTLKLSDSSKLDAALANNLTGVRDLFTNSTNGLAVKLDSYLNSTIGDNGSLVSHQNTLTKQVADIDTQIADAEKRVQEDRQRMIDEFVAMETAQARINQQLQFLAQNLGGTVAPSATTPTPSTGRAAG